MHQQKFSQTFLDVGRDLIKELGNPKNKTSNSDEPSPSDSLTTTNKSGEQIMRSCQFMNQEKEDRREEVNGKSAYDSQTSWKINVKRNIKIKVEYLFCGGLCGWEGH